MSVSSVLICGGGPAGHAAAVALAKQGLDVVLAQSERSWDPDAVVRLRAAGIETRLGTALVGAVRVDRHVEAELSDGRVENYDIVVIADGAASDAPQSTEPSRPAWRIVGDDVHGAEVRDAIGGASARDLA